MPDGGTPPLTDAGGTATATCTLKLNVETDIFQMKCNTISCHEGPTSASQLDLTSPGVKQRLLNKKSNSCPPRTIVTLGAPDMSVILDRISATPACGVRMPLGRDPLSSGELDCVKAWVENAVLSSTTSTGK